GREARRRRRHHAAERAAPALFAPADRQGPRRLPRRLGQDRPVHSRFLIAMADNKATALSTELIGADQVVAYLERHPEFLNDHPQLLELLTQPDQQLGAGVLDMQKFMVIRLRER